MCSVVEKTKERMQLYFMNEREVYKRYDKQKETVEQLRRDRELDHERSEDNEMFEEIEEELLTTRQELLEKKLLLTDTEEELEEQRKKNEDLMYSLKELEGQKQELDTLVISVSQQIKGREKMMESTWNIAKDKDRALKQLEQSKLEN